MILDRNTVEAAQINVANQDRNENARGAGSEGLPDSFEYRPPKACGLRAGKSASRRIGYRLQNLVALAFGAEPDHRPEVLIVL